jgi:hypothetical protein
MLSRLSDRAMGYVFIVAGMLMATGAGTWLYLAVRVIRSLIDTKV